MVLPSDKHMGEYIKRVNLNIHTCSPFSSADTRSYISLIRNKKIVSSGIVYSILVIKFQQATNNQMTTVLLKAVQI